MPESSSNNQRIAKNTMFLYFRMIITMAVSLYTSRVILQTLGVDDFGIYNLVGGVTAMFQFLNGTLADATQRYITVEIGKGDGGNIIKIFSICLLLHAILGIIIVIIAEPLGLWMLHNKLIIPADRLGAATWIFHFSVISLFIVIISVPYNALIIAHEKMNAFAIISIMEAVGKLLIVFALLIGNMDRLILYGALMLLMQTAIMLLYKFYCNRNFSESKFHYYWDKGLVKEISCFASWTIIGNLAFVCVTQGISILLGMFFMPAVNAARGIAVQIQTVVSNFVRNFQTAVNPQITKYYASNKLEEMRALLFRSSRYSFYLLIIPLIPLLLETDILLNLWLTEVPDYTKEILQIVLLIVCMNTLSFPIGVAIKATGQIRDFELYAITIYFLVLPITFFLLKMGFSPLSAFIVYLITEFVALIVKIYITGNHIGFSLIQYFREVLMSIIAVSFLAIPLPLIVCSCMEASFLRLICVLIVSLLSSALAIVSVGITKSERDFFLNIIKSRIIRMKGA